MWFRACCSTFAIVVSGYGYGLTFTQSILSPAQNLGSGDSLSFEINLNELTGYDVSGGQLIIEDAFFSFSYNQAAHLTQQTDSYTFISETTPTSWDLTYRIPPVVYDGVAYSIHGSASAYTYYETERTAASADYEIANAVSGALTFGRDQSTSFNHSEFQVRPGVPEILLQTDFYDVFDIWESDSSHSSVYLDLLSLIDEDSVLLLELLGNEGTVQLSGITLSFEYGANPNWTPIPLPAAGWIFCGALSLLISAKKGLKS